MAFSGMINVKTGLLTLGGQFEAYKRGQLERKIQFILEIDRKRPNEEYTTDNSVLCCYWCNNAKTDEFCATEFKAIGEEIGKIWRKRLSK